ncbi:MAG: hypothetical protein KAH22_00130 [Thiotrichaceae bacterium]|nr:hypothetical protein [Thiotrichaceae bacterium]
MTPLIFSIQTILDVDLARHKYKLDGLSDIDVAKATFHLQKQSKEDVLPLAMQRIVLITTVQYRDNEINVTCYRNTSEDGEASLLRCFLEDLAKNDYQLLPWSNDEGAIPLLLLRCYKHALSTQILHNVQCKQGVSQLITGSDETLLSFNDAKDLLGFPHKNEEIDIWQCWVDKDYDKIQQLGNHLVLSYYMLYCHYQWVSGRLSKERYQHRLALLTV